MASEENTIAIPKIGSFYYVKRSDGNSRKQIQNSLKTPSCKPTALRKFEFQVSAEVLETRINEVKGNCLEYFVHYENRTAAGLFTYLPGRVKTTIYLFNGRRQAT
jgi:hypothetical protein